MIVDVTKSMGIFGRNDTSTQNFAKITIFKISRIACKFCQSIDPPKFHWQNSRFRPKFTGIFSLRAQILQIPWELYWQTPPDFSAATTQICRENLGLNFQSEICSKFSLVTNPHKSQKLTIFDRSHPEFIWILLGDPPKT